MDFSEERVIATAVHEAGHVATAFFLGREVENASISPVMTHAGLRRGQCTTRPRGGDESDRGLHEFEEDLVISLGGPIAQLKLETEQYADLDALPEGPYQRLSDHLGGDSAAIEARLRELKELAVEIAGRADIHRATEAVAQRLLGDPEATIPGTELRRLFDEAAHA